MSWLQILAQAGIIATFLGVGIAVAAYFNGKHIKEGVKETGEIIAKIGEVLERMERCAEERHTEVLEFLRAKV